MNHLNDVFSYESLVHAVAGAMGSVTAMSVFFPLDTARLRLQVDDERKAKSPAAVLKEIIREEGLLAPYRGWFPVICSLCCSNFVYFYCFHSLKATWLKGQRSSPGTDLLLGIAAGVVNVLLTTPLWVVNTRLKLQGAKFRNEDIQSTNYRGIIDAFVQIVQEEGAGALWNGTFPSLLLVLNPALQFMIYEGLKRKLSRVPHTQVMSANSPALGRLFSELRSVYRLFFCVNMSNTVSGIVYYCGKQLKRKKGAYDLLQVIQTLCSQLSSAEVFIIGAIAKALATTTTYPLQTVQSVLRFGQHNRPAEDGKLMSSLRWVVFLLISRVRKWGLLGLFKGLEAKLLQTVLTAALMFVLYEKISSTTFRVMGVTRP